MSLVNGGAQEKGKLKDLAPTMSNIRIDEEAEKSNGLQEIVIHAPDGFIDEGGEEGDDYCESSSSSSMSLNNFANGLEGGAGGIGGDINSRMLSRTLSSPLPTHGSQSLLAPAPFEDLLLTELLIMNDLGQYAQVFADHEVDLKTFFRLKESHLIDMGFDRVGTRVKIMGLISDGADKQIGNNLTKEARKARTGEILFEELTFMECVGRGSYGSVYKGKWRSEIVAIKKILTPCSKEADLLSKVRHKNVIQCFGVCTEAPNYCIVMEFAEQSLKQAIYDHGMEIKPTVVVDWATQIALGMNYLHTEAPVIIIHRDLKPANVLITSNNVLKISDFGLSRIRQTDMTDKMSSVGTFEYMPPEIIRNEPYNEKVDVYSFGVLVWEMLTRKVPYSGLPPLSVAFGVGSGTLKLPMPSKCPVSISAVLSRCLDHDHRKRISFKELVSALDLLKSSEFIQVPQIEFVQLQKDWQNELGGVFETLKREVEALKRKQAELSVTELSLDERERRLRERELSLNHNLSSSFVCRQTLRRFNEDIIGLGLSVARTENKTILKIEFVPEYLSATAFFDHEVRHSMNHELSFQYFLPLYICKEHYHKAATMMEDAFFCIVTGLAQLKEPRKPDHPNLTKTASASHLPTGSSPSHHQHFQSSRSTHQSRHLHSSSNPFLVSAPSSSSPSLSPLPASSSNQYLWLPASPGTQRSKTKEKVKSRPRSRSSSELDKITFHPEMALMVLCMTINEVLVSAINERLHPFKALEIYCVFHRILLAFAEKYPILIEICDRQINDFILSEKDRNESEFPNLGEFMVMFIISTVPWGAAVKAVIDEILQRTWKWILKANPELGMMRFNRQNPLFPVEIENVSVDELLEKTFASSLGGIRVIMLHVYFLKNIAHYKNKNLQQLRAQYDDLYGQPKAKLKEKAEQAFKDIFSVSSYAQYFAQVGYTPTDTLATKEEVSVILRTAASKGYWKKYFSTTRFKSRDGFVLLS